MSWMESISKAICFIEENLTEDITIEKIAKEAYLSPFYFQKGFTMLCGYSISEYIRYRRLTLSSYDLIHSKQKIIDIALKYGYDSPDSFTKAFTRFHHVTPSEVRKNGAMVKDFAPLKINFLLKGGYTMDYKIKEKDAFTVIGKAKTFKYENAAQDVPMFWNDFVKSEKNHGICGMYGINMDLEMNGNEFEYMIADDYDVQKKVIDGFITKTIPKHTWAIFACKGPSSKSMPETNQKIFTEWLPNSKNYEISAGYNIEMYEDPAEYPNGVQDENYYCEIWIPVCEKNKK